MHSVSVVVSWNFPISVKILSTVLNWSEMYVAVPNSHGIWLKLARIRYHLSSYSNFCLRFCGQRIFLKFDIDFREIYCVDLRNYWICFSENFQCRLKDRIWDEVNANLNILSFVWSKRLKLNGREIGMTSINEFFWMFFRLLLLFAVVVVVVVYFIFLRHLRFGLFVFIY